MPGCPICKKLETSLFCQIKSYHYYFCPNCQTLFLFPQQHIQQLNRYYKKNFVYENGLPEENNIRKRARIILRTLQKINPHGETLLDVGSGYGFFIDEAQKIGLKPIGIEPSKKLYNYLNNRILTIGLTFEEFYKRKFKKKFDFITAIHVIEHVLDPKKFIKQATSLLSKDGIFYIETPNLDSHLFYAERENYTFLTPPEHLWVFSLNSFKTLLLSFCSNLILNRSKTYSYPEHLMGIIKQNFQSISKFKISRNKIDNKISNNLTSKIKILIFDRLLAPMLTPLLNFGNKGSILELYIKKKS